MARRLEEWQQDLVRNVGTKAVQDLVDDFRSYSPSPRSLTPPATVSIVGAGKTTEPTVGPKYRPYQPTDDNADRSGWREAPGLKPPEGLQYIDQMLDQEDQAWRLQRAKELAAAKAARALVEGEIKDAPVKADDKKGGTPK
jgi:hypothetical protein